MSSILILAIKDLRLLARDRFGLFWVLGFPLAMAVLFGAMMGGGGEKGSRALSIAVADEDGTDGSRAFVKRLEDSDALRVQRSPGAGGAPGELLSREEAVDAVRRGKLVAYVVLKKGFGDSVPFVGGGGEDGAQSVEVGIDPARKAEAGYLQGILMEATFRQLQDRFSDPARARCSRMGSAISNPRCRTGSCRRHRRRSSSG